MTARRRWRKCAMRPQSRGDEPCDRNYPLRYGEGEATSSSELLVSFCVIIIMCFLCSKRACLLYMPIRPPLLLCCVFLFQMRTAENFNQKLRRVLVTSASKTPLLYTHSIGREVVSLSINAAEEKRGDPFRQSRPMEEEPQALANGCHGNEAKHRFFPVLEGKCGPGAAGCSCVAAEV